MRWLSIAEIQANLDPRYRLQKTMAMAKLEMEERHHQEQIQLQQQRMYEQQQQQEATNRAMIERERIAGENALALSRQNFVLQELGKETDLIHSFYEAHFNERRDWNNTFANTMQSLLLAEVNLVAQQKLNQQASDLRIKEMEIAHRQKMELVILESNLRFIDKHIDNTLQNMRISFDYMANILYRLIEKSVGLGDYQMNEKDLQDWVREAMEQM